jgi:hypothetical protein
MIEAKRQCVGAPQAIETEAALALVDGLTERLRFQEIHVFEAVGRYLPSGFARLARIGRGGGDLFWQACFHTSAALGFLFFMIFLTFRRDIANFGLHRWHKERANSGEAAAQQGRRQGPFENSG